MVFGTDCTKKMCHYEFCGVHLFKESMRACQELSRTNIVISNF